MSFFPVTCYILCVHTRFLLIIWLDAADVRWLFVHEDLHKMVKTVLELCCCSVWSLLCCHITCWEHFLLKEHNHTEKQNYFHAVICDYRISLSSWSMILLLHHILALNLTGVTNITHEAYGSTTIRIVVLLYIFEEFIT